MNLNPLQPIVDAKSNPALISDVKRNIVCVNQKLESLFGYPSKFLSGQSLEILLPERFRDGHPFFFNQYVNSPETVGSGNGLTLWGVHKSGKEFQIDTKLEITQFSGIKCVICEVIAMKSDQET